jgi:hypothetical protein
MFLPLRGSNLIKVENKLRKLARENLFHCGYMLSELLVGSLLLDASGILATHQPPPDE